MLARFCAITLTEECSSIEMFSARDWYPDRAVSSTSVASRAPRQEAPSRTGPRLRRDAGEREHGLARTKGHLVDGALADVERLRDAGHVLRERPLVGDEYHERFSALRKVGEWFRAGARARGVAPPDLQKVYRDFSPSPVPCL
jgi:hypothetical protein